MLESDRHKYSPKNQNGMIELNLADEDDFCPCGGNYITNISVKTNQIPIINTKCTFHIEYAPLIENDSITK
ncbi:MAG: hypothetical protein GYA62_03440 [Bacteroidales bacterium]|nr:hypothetical protein [Bacteroidales bacterium]